MSTKYGWICTNIKCGNEVSPVSGGFDRGFEIKTQTRVCNSCKNVEDYKIGVVSDPSHRMFTQEEHANHENLEPKCATCGGETVAWTLTCPVCGSQMEHGVTFQLSD